MRTRRIIVSLVELLICVLAWAGISQSYCQGQWEEFTYFTYQTNFMVGVVYLWASIATITGGKQPWAWLRGGVLLYIFTTGLVANFILPAPDYATEYRAFGFIPNSLLVHISVPILCLLDYVLFERHRHYRWWYPLTWPLYIYCWFVFVIIRASAFPHAGVDPGSHDPYPYFFLNIPKVGWGGILKDFILFTIFFLVLGYILYGIDKALPRTAVVPTTTLQDLRERAQRSKNRRIARIENQWPRESLSPDAPTVLVQDGVPHGLD